MMFCVSKSGLWRNATFCRQIQKSGKRTYFTPNFSRDAKFSKLEDKDVSVFKAIVGESGLIYNDRDALEFFNVDWMKKYKGNTSLVLRPKTTEQVSNILKYCNERRLAVVPQGGNTGLVGGSVPVFDEIVISTSLMSNIISFDDVSGIAVCQSGVVLGTLDEYLNKRGYTVPLDLGAKGSCQIGGNIATNAGGIRLLRYGSLHGNVLGLEAVLADGTVLDSLTTLRKDNTGYDLKQLFIGSEGTLGIITTVSLLTPPKPNAVHVAFLSCKNFESVQKIYRKAKEDLGEILSAVEFVDRASIELVLQHLPGARDPFSQDYPFYVLIESSGSNEAHDQEKLHKFLEDMMGEEVVLDGSVSQNDSQAAELWKLREGCPEAVARAGVTYKYDISLPLAQFYNIVEDMRNRIGKRGTVVGYGHVGDGNLHLNVSTPEFNPEVLKLIEPYIYEWTANYRGSISAEHGIGVMKPDHLHFSKSAPMIQVMKNIKNSMDPNGILNPYKVLPRIQ